MADEGFGAVHRRVIQQDIGFFLELLTELIETRHHGGSVDGSMEQVWYQGIVTFQKSEDIEPLVMRRLRQLQGVTDRLPACSRACRLAIRSWAR